MPTIAEIMASADTPQARERMWQDPESFGRDAGATGATLAEFVGAIRFGRRGREDESLLLIRKASVDVERGSPWPFTGAGELQEALELTRLCTDHLIRLKAYGRAAPPSAVRSSRAWAEALLTEAVRIADSTEVLETVVADSIVAARNLVSACDLHPGATTATP